jgi:hypothetical protein
MIRISALTIFIIDLQCVRFIHMIRGTYNRRKRDPWNVMAEIMFGGALAVKRVALTTTGL